MPTNILQFITGLAMGLYNPEQVQEFAQRLLTVQREAELEGTNIPAYNVMLRAWCGDTDGLAEQARTVTYTASLR